MVTGKQTMSGKEDFSPGKNVCGERYQDGGTGNVTLHCRVTVNVDIFACINFSQIYENGQFRVC